MCDCFCSDFNEMSKTEPEKKAEEVLQEIKQERALWQYSEKTDDVFLGWESFLCLKGVAWFR
jgi:hypothetical protein